MIYREKFDIAVNTITLYVHFSQDYIFANGALQRMTVRNSCSGRLCSSSHCSIV